MQKDMYYMTLKKDLLKNPDKPGLKEEFLRHVKQVHRNEAPPCAYCYLNQFMIPGVAGIFKQSNGIDYEIEGFRCDICGYISIKGVKEIKPEETPEVLSEVAPE